MQVEQTQIPSPANTFVIASVNLLENIPKIAEKLNQFCSNFLCFCPKKQRKQFSNNLTLQLLFQVISEHKNNPDNKKTMTCNHKNAILLCFELTSSFSICKKSLHKKFPFQFTFDLLDSPKPTEMIAMT